MTPDKAAQRAVSAIHAWDEVAYNAAGRELIDACKGATAKEIERALVRLGPALAEVELGRAWALADTAGVMAFGLADVAPFLGIFVERACQAMEQAAQFRALHEGLLGEAPPSADRSAYRDAATRFTDVARARVSEPIDLVDAWFYGNAWVRPILMLSQRAEVRDVMPQRERLLRAVEAVGDDFDNAQFLYGLLLVLDNAPLLVLHRPTSRAFRLTIGGIGFNEQLHTLIAARLIGDPDAGWLPGEPPTATMIAAADAGDWLPEGGIVGQFSIVDIYGRPLDDKPAYIPLVDGERVIVLDPPAHPLRWNAGRVYPLMKPTMRVDALLSADAASTWLAKARPPQLSDGPTDDLAVPGHDAVELVDFVLGEVLNDTPSPAIERLLVARLGLSESDAAIARDRALGGIFRAGTNPANRPNPDKDPVAFESYRRASADPTLRARVFPG